MREFKKNNPIGDVIQLVQDKGYRKIGQIMKLLEAVANAIDGKPEQIKELRRDAEAKVSELRWKADEAEKEAEGWRLLEDRYCR